MSKIKFQPRVGKESQKGLWGHKVLVLGESHYGNGPERADVTQEVIDGFLNPENEFEGWMNTYTKFGRALAGEPLERGEQAPIWDKVVFYNYVQNFISEARVAPTAQEFENSTAAFKEVLNQVKPDVILAWGKRLYANLPNFGQQGADIEGVDGERIQTWEYPLENGKMAHVLPITHPSTGFSWDKWHKVIKKYIKNR